jgi:hypothetical protein
MGFVAVVCGAIVGVCYVMVWFAWDVVDLHGLIKIPPLSGVQCLYLALVWAAVAIVACVAYITLELKYNTYGDQDSGSADDWIDYDEAVQAVKEALPQLEVTGPIDQYAQQLFVSLLDGPRGSSGEIRYLDAVFAIADCLRDCDANTFGRDCEEVAERILAPRPHGCMAR